MESKEHKVYKVVLTGGPCGGKTTGQARLCTFFENLGWKVFRVPETAQLLLSGGVKFSDLTLDEMYSFQENLLKTMLQIENTFFALGESCQRDCLIICDRGAMDASAYIAKDKWEKIMSTNSMNSIELRDNRYNQIIHMVSAAEGAEDFYTLEFREKKRKEWELLSSCFLFTARLRFRDLSMLSKLHGVLDRLCGVDHTCRSEGIDLARELDQNAASAWVGHPYFDVVDNSTDFEKKICRMIAAICQKLGIDTGDRLLTNSRKRKFLVKGPLPDASVFPAFQDFEVVHHYLISTTPYMQTRLRKRGQKGQCNYTHTIRKPRMHGQIVEVKSQVTQRDYSNMLTQKDESHFPIYKKRRCFLYNNQYFQLDIYEIPCHPRCKGLILLETYSTMEEGQLEKNLPKFLTIDSEVTGNPAYSMFNLSLKEEWNTSKKFCHVLKAPEDAHDGTKTNGLGEVLNVNGSNV